MNSVQLCKKKKVVEQASDFRAKPCSETDTAIKYANESFALFYYSFQPRLDIIRPKYFTKILLVTAKTRVVKCRLYQRA